MDKFKTNESNLLARYLLKLAPDFSVFDIAEKYLADHDANTIFYKGINSATHNTTFRRGMFKLEGDYSDATLDSASAANITYTSFDTDGCRYLIVINDESGISLTFNKAVEIIGVAF